MACSPTGGTCGCGRSLTQLDQRAGEAVSWARLSYYAGVAPDGGLAMPADVALYPVMPEWAVRYGYGGAASSERELRWTRANN